MIDEHGLIQHLTVGQTDEKFRTSNFLTNLCQLWDLCQFCPGILLNVHRDYINMILLINSVEFPYNCERFHLVVIHLSQSAINTECRYTIPTYKLDLKFRILSWIGAQF